MTNEDLQRPKNPPDPDDPNDDIVAPPVDTSKPTHLFLPVEGNRFCGECGAGKLHPIHKVRLAFRGFLDGRVQFEEHIAVDLADMAQVLPKLAGKHADAVARRELGIVEIEFLDEPNPNERFFRIGADPSGMVMPIEVKL